jgi:peptide deformylase
VVTYPDARLRQPTVKVEAVTEEIRTLVRDLTETMYAKDGIGMAAIQIGSPEKLFVLAPEIARPAIQRTDPLVFINPEIVSVSTETEVRDEGCLSFPGFHVPVARPTKAKLRATDIHGASFELEGEGLLGRAMLHEFDHLDGKLMIDYAGSLKRSMMLKKLKKLKRG